MHLLTEPYKYQSLQKVMFLGMVIKTDGTGNGDGWIWGKLSAREGLLGDLHPVLSP